MGADEVIYFGGYGLVCCVLLGLCVTVCFWLIMFFGLVSVW